MSAVRKLAWWAVAVLNLVLVCGSLPAMIGDIRRADLVRILAQASEMQWGGSVGNPLACARPFVSSSEYQARIRTALAAAPGEINNYHVVAAAFCLLGESGKALDTYRSFGSADLTSTLTQFVILTQHEDPASAIQTLVANNLSNDQWLTSADVIVNRVPGVDSRSLLRSLAERLPGEKQVWVLWLQVGSRIQMSGDWASALAWYREGLQHPSGLQGSFAQHAGRILQSAADPLDDHAALEFYDQAIASGEFLSVEEESNAYLFRGDSYRALPKEFTPAQVLTEYERSLEIAPSSYWACINLGSLYLSVLKDIDKANSYFRRAMQLDASSPYAYYYLGEVARAKGDLKQARQFYVQAIAIMPNWQSPQNRLTSLGNDK